MSERKSYITYKSGNRIKNIYTLAGLKRYSTCNKNNTLTFQELLSHNKFTFHHSLAGQISNKCRLCTKELPIFKIDEFNKQVFLSLCPCSVKSPLVVNKMRFLSIFDEEIVDEKYSEYCKNKMRKWTTKDIPVASLNFKINKFGEEEGKKRYDAIRKTMDSTSVSYYMKKGNSLEEATKLCKERQSTFSKEKCILKFGEEEGLKIWQDRQLKWQQTLNSKSIEEIERINQLKLWKSGGVSRISQKLFEKLNVPNARWGHKRTNNLGEKLIVVNNVKYMVDFLVGDKIIEFNGDYWHANPNIYSENCSFKCRKGVLTAKEIWYNDSVKLNNLTMAGFKVFIVWENDFRKNPDKVIIECQNFLRA